MRSSAPSVNEYLAELPPERRKVVSAVRAVIRKNLPQGYVETMNWGMICYEIPLRTYPVTYNKQPLAYAALAAQKNNYAIYMMGYYGQTRHEETLRRAFAALGKKPDMGKSCLRFKTLEDIPLATIGELIAGITPAEYIKIYERSRADGE